ncbi:MAG: branched-chain amino acid aminotransferase [Pseudomonadota bacterium]
MVQHGSSRNALTYFDGQWLEGNPGIFGPMTHAVWLGSLVFDGARAFEGTTPDLDRHCSRTVRSAEAMGLGTPVGADEILNLAEDGVAKLPEGKALYIRPMFWATAGFIAPDPETTQFALSVYESPLPDIQGVSCSIASKRRPTPETAPTTAKAACLYPQSGLAIAEARSRGFENAIVLDAVGNVAELASANVLAAKDGVVFTPIPNGCFLDGITRQRVIGLLRDDGVEVVERTVTTRDLLEADEVFSTGNYWKVVPITRIEDQHYQPGRFYKRARELYWDYAHSA